MAPRRAGPESHIERPRKSIQVLYPGRPAIDATVAPASSFNPAQIPVPRPFASFAKGWDSTNLNKPFSTQHKTWVPHVPRLWGRGKARISTPPFSTQHKPGCPILSRFLRKGGNARISAHLFQLSTTPGAPSFRAFCERVGQHEPQQTVLNSAQTRVPHVPRVWGRGTARTSTYPFQPAQTPVPRDRTNPGPPPIPSSGTNRPVAIMTK
jgi:hypothetical protein